MVREVVLSVPSSNVSSIQLIPIPGSLYPWCREKAPAFRPHRKERETMKKIYVGNMPFSATEDQIRQLFSEHGAVESG